LFEVYAPQSVNIAVPLCFDRQIARRSPAQDLSGLIPLTPANIASQYPVIMVHTADRDAIIHHDPSIITASTNRHVLQPTGINKKRRKSKIQELQANADKGKRRDSSVSGESSSKDKSARPLLSTIASNSTSSSSSKSDRSQLVDLVVEDHAAETLERVRARKEGGSEWNEAEPKHFVRTFPEEGVEEVVREGYEPGKQSPLQPHGDEQNHNLDHPFRVGDGDDDNDGDAEMWQHRDYEGEREGEGEGDDSDGKQKDKKSPSYGSFPEERDIWGDSRDS